MVLISVPAVLSQVPFGSIAFMPGKLIHTNEILVLLGDNWFVERSAAQAQQIVERRMKCKSTSCIFTVPFVLIFFRTEGGKAKELICFIV